jgi:hypothetical protein
MLLETLLRATTPLGLASVGSLCARAARAIENSGSSASPDGFSHKS